MTRKRWIGLAALVAVVAVAAGGWYFFIRDDAPPPVSLEGALEQASSTTVGPVEGGTLPLAGTTAPPGPAESLDGSWGVDPAAESFVGYRVQEELSNIGGATAVGRTSGVEAALELAGTSVTRIDVEADLTTLESDSSQRDGQLASRGLETNSFPTASFRLTAPIELGAIPAIGEEISAIADGELTLHGVTRAVQVPVEAQLTDTQILVIGSLPIFLPDYGIVAPTGFRVLSIDDNAEMEFQIFFVQS